jgi:hypothetical protein
MRNDKLQALFNGFYEGYHETRVSLLSGFKRGIREGMVTPWTPFRPRTWRYVTHEARRGGLLVGLCALLRADDLILAGKLDAQGRVQD